MATVRPISPQYQHTLDSAISLAKELASKNMADSGDNSPKTPNSPDKRRFNFKLKHFSKSFSEASANIRDIESSISHEAKQAYKSLVERGPYNTYPSQLPYHHQTIANHGHHQYTNDDFSASFAVSSNKMKHTIIHNERYMAFVNQGNQYSRSILKHIYRKRFKGTNIKYACFLLNINDSFSKYNYIWDEASFKVAVDGSANYLAKRGMVQTADVISGDFDSIEAGLVERLRCPDEATKVPQIIETPSQKETDFTKAIRVTMGKRPDINLFFGLYHSDGSRMDHLFGLVNTLHLVKRNIIIVNVRSNTISWVLAPGSHTIHKPGGQELCSLVPFTGPTEVKTQGLEYNMGPSTVLSFGGLISTSNLCRADCKAINIVTNREILWSIDALI